MTENENKSDDTSDLPQENQPGPVHAPETTVTGTAPVEVEAGAETAVEDTAGEAQAEPAPLPSADRPKHNPHATLDNVPVSPNPKIPTEYGPGFYKAQALRIGESLTTFPVDIKDMEHLGESYKAVDMTRSDQQRNFVEP